MQQRFLAAILVLAGLSAASGQDIKPAALDRLASESLRDVHDRGADLFNSGEVSAAYRMYQGGLIVARGMLAHRPETQKRIATGLSGVEREDTSARKAFLLHELIEQVRADLRVPISREESLTIPPREVKPDPKPMASVGEVTSGVLGRVLWEGQPVGGVEVMFVSLGRLVPRIYETTTGAQGVYVLGNLEAGKYIVTIVPGPQAKQRKLPERYATTTTSPLVFDVKGTGEKLDFLLQ